MLVSLYPINVVTAKPSRPNIFTGNSQDPKEGLWRIKIKHGDRKKSPYLIFWECTNFNEKIIEYELQRKMAT